MKEEKDKAISPVGIDLMFLVCGVLATLLVGWVIFPSVLYSEKPQPVNFPHLVHKGEASCEDCHYFRDDGTYSGIPTVENCKQCHEDMLGESEDERKLVEDFIQKDLPVKWHVYARQPDNVYFSHVPHVGESCGECHKAQEGDKKPPLFEEENSVCLQCHRPVEGESKLPPYKENRLTGYSKYVEDHLKMDFCEKCHEKHGTSNACQVCHK